jgi:hypothetical protein
MRIAATKADAVVRWRMPIKYFLIRAIETEPAEPLKSELGDMCFMIRRHSVRRLARGLPSHLSV